MKVEDAKICASCDEIYKGFKCPVCGFDQSISLERSLMALPGPDNRVRKVATPHPEKLRLLERRRSVSKNIVSLIREAGDKIKGLESLQ